jgi:hypothetical protein
VTIKRIEDEHMRIDTVDECKLEYYQQYEDSKVSSSEKFQQKRDIRSE